MTMYASDLFAIAGLTDDKVVYTPMKINTKYKEILARKVGGKTPIKDVKTNKKIQELGKYCVEEYNKSLRKYKQIMQDDNIELLSFVEVVEAETQVVSGIKYYLKISTFSFGIPKIFNAELVVNLGRITRIWCTFHLFIMLMMIIN
ncbi:hypothetical protein P3S67_032470 [Capsicum chacoense]